MKPPATNNGAGARTDVRWPLLRPIRVRHYLSVMREYDVDEGTLFSGTSIDPNRLDEAEYRVPCEAIRRLIANLLLLSGDGGIGFDMGLNSNLSALGILSGALLSCRQVGDTLAVWRRFSEPIIGITSRLIVEPDTDGDLWLTIFASEGNRDVQRFSVEELLGLIIRLGEVECGVPPHLTALQLAYPAPAHANRYRKILGCSAQFGAEQTRLRVSKAWAQQPIISHDRELNDLCLDRCAELLERLQLGAGLGFVARQLYELLLRRIHKPPQLEEAARELHLSSRTLKRRLQAEGASYQSVLQQCRKDVAVDYLRSGRMPVHKVADKLGFADERSFRRAFLSWTGVAPSGFCGYSRSEPQRTA